MVGKLLGIVNEQHTRGTVFLPQLFPRFEYTSDVSWHLFQLKGSCQEFLELMVRACVGFKRGVSPLCFPPQLLDEARLTDPFGTVNEHHTHACAPLFDIGKHDAKQSHLRVASYECTES